MSLDTQSMIVAKDQFWSWGMVSTRAKDLAREQAAASGVSRHSFFQARNALYHSLGFLGIEPGSRVLVPAYICRAAIEPLEAYGVKVDFYDVTRACLANVEDLESRVSSATQAIVVVHYFGFPQSMGRIKRLCAAKGLVLIEDCAHVLCGENEGEPLGAAGDAAVFSWRKFLPIYDGAELVLNKPAKRQSVQLSKESGLFTLRVAANMLDASLSQTRRPLLKLAYRTMQAGENIFRRYAKSRIDNNPMMQAEATAVDFEMQNVNWPMSRLSRWTKRHADIEGITATRRRNFKILLDELSDSKAQPLYRNLPATGCPWIFPALFPGIDEAYLRLRERGIPAVTWGWVRHPSIPHGRFADSDFLYDNLVFLPIHQCLKDEDMMKIARVVKELYSR